MKNIVTISFLLFCCWQFIGTFIYFESSKYKIKNEVNNLLNDLNKKKEIETIIFTQSEYQTINWVDKKEFIYQSNMYDVKKIIQAGKNIKIYCYLDHKEKELIQSFAKKNDTDKRNNDQNKYQLIWLKIIQTSLITSDNYYQPITIHTSEELQKAFFYYSARKYNVCISTNDKPPIIC